MSNNDPFPFGPIGDDERYADDCVPHRNPFQQPAVDFLQVLPGPTTLELAKALRDCFAATNGRVPTAPLDELIARYDFTITMETTLDGEQLEANRYDPIDKSNDVPPSNHKIPMPPGVKPPVDDSEPHEKNGFGD